MHFPHSCSLFYAQASSPVWTAFSEFLWLWSMRGSGRRWEDGRRKISKYVFPQLPPWQVAAYSPLPIAMTSVKQSSQGSYSISSTMAPSTCLHLEVVTFLRVSTPRGLHYPLLVSSNSAHTLVNCLFIKHSSNCLFWFMLFSCQLTDRKAKWKARSHRVFLIMIHTSDFALSTMGSHWGDLRGEVDGQVCTVKKLLYQLLCKEPMGRSERVEARRWVKVNHSHEDGKGRAMML